MELKSHTLDDFSIQDGFTFVWEGVMDNVSGLRDISCRLGMMRMDSCGLCNRRAWKDAAIVDKARRRLEDISLDGGVLGSLRNIWMIRRSSSESDLSCVGS